MHRGGPLWPGTAWAGLGTSWYGCHRQEQMAAPGLGGKVPPEGTLENSSHQILCASGSFWSPLTVTVKLGSCVPSLCWPGGPHPPASLIPSLERGRWGATPRSRDPTLRGGPARQAPHVPAHQRPSWVPSVVPLASDWPAGWGCWRGPCSGPSVVGSCWHGRCALSHRGLRLSSLGLWFLRRCGCGGPKATAAACIAACHRSSLAWPLR